MFWEKLEQGAQSIRSSAKNSRILQALAGKPIVFRPIGNSRAAFHRAVLANMERSKVAAWAARFRAALFSAPLYCCGIFFFSFGAVALLVPLLAGNTTDLSLFLPGVSIAGLALCFSKKSLAQGLEDSDLMRWFFFCYCGFSKPVFFAKSMRNPAFKFLFAGISAGALGALLGATRVLSLLAFAIFLPIAFAVPEAVLPPILLAFPFLGSTGHASLLLGVLAAFALIVRLPKLLAGHRQDRFGRVDTVVLLFGLLLILDCIINAAGGDFGGLLLFCYLASVWFALRPAMLLPSWRDRIFFCFLLSGSICSGIGILQYFSGKAELKWLEIARFGMLGGRVSATFSNPNFLAVYLLAVFGISLGWITKSEKNRWFGLAPLILSAGCLILTWTRGAWLGALAAICFFLLFRSAGSFALLSVLPFFVPGIFPLFPQGIRARFGSIGDLAETSSHYRLETWRGVLRLLRANPFGIGGGETAFHLIFPTYAVSGTESVMHAHNVYLQLAVEHGVVGLAVFLFLLVLLFRGYFAAWKKQNGSGERGLFLGVAAGMIGLLTMGFFDHLWYQPSLFCLFWMLAAGLSAFALAAGEEIYET